MAPYDNAPLNTSYDYIITGAGAAGLLTAVRMSADPFFKDKRILLLDKDRKQTNDRTWCWWEKEGGLFDDILHHHWSSILVKDDTHEVRPQLAPLKYKMLRSEAFYSWAFAQLDVAENISFVTADILEIREDDAEAKVNTSAGLFSATLVLNSAMPTEHHDRSEKYPVLQQHFVGWFVRTEQSMFDSSQATFMDFNIPQKGNTRFMYVLPTSETDALFEYTLFSVDLLEQEEYEQGIRDYITGLGITDYEIVEKERGSIPMTAYPFNVHDTTHVHHIGTAGGWTKGSTGYTFSNAMRESKRLVETIRSKKDLSALKTWNRFDWYDAVLLDVLSAHNHRGGELFTGMFKKGNALRNLKFLDEETSFFEEVKVMMAMPILLFAKTAFKRLFK